MPRLFLSSRMRLANRYSVFSVKGLIPPVWRPASQIKVNQTIAVKQAMEDGRIQRLLNQGGSRRHLEPARGVSRQEASRIGQRCARPLGLLSFQTSES